MRPRAEDERAPRPSADDFGTTVIAEFLSSVLVCTAIGLGLDAWLGTGPWLLVAGAVLGFGMGTWLVYLRYDDQSARDRAERASR